MESGVPTLDNNEQKTPRKRDTGEFLARWLKESTPDYVKQNETDDEDEEDSADSRKEKSKRQGILARFIAKRQIQKEEVKTKPESIFERFASRGSKQESEIRSTPITFEDLLANNSKNADEIPNGDGELHAEPPSDYPVEGTANTFNEEEAPSGPVAEGAGGGDQPPTGPPTGELQGNAEEPDKDDEASVSRKTVWPHDRASAIGTSTPRGGIPRLPFEHRGADASTSDMDGFRPIRAMPRESETIIERRGGGLAALALFGVGAERFGRRRADKRLERRTNKKIAKSNEVNLQREHSLNRRLEQVNSYNREEAVRSRLVNERFEKDIKERPVQQKELLPAKNVIASSPAILRPIFNPETGHVTDKNIEKLEKFLPEREVFTTPIKEKVIIKEQLEHKPIEQLYERRHEVKDESSPLANGQAASLATILDSQHGDSSNIKSASLSESAIVDQQQSIKPTGGSMPAMYKQAVTMGLWGAILIIILGALAYTFFIKF